MLQLGVAPGESSVVINDLCVLATATAMSREHFFYGALVGAGAVALGCGASLATFGLWRLVQVSSEGHGASCLSIVLP